MSSQKPNCGQLTYRAKNQPGLDTVPSESELWDFASSWIKRFDETDEKNAAEKFIYLWVTINAWASLSVPDRTQNHIDAYLVHSLSADKKYQERFENLKKSNLVFKKNVYELSNLGPIFQVLWMRNEYIDAWDESKENRQEFVSRIREKEPFNITRDGQKIPAFAPGCAYEHYNVEGAIPEDWTHTLSMIYQIRCNLFHGGKNYNSNRDFRFIKLAYSILWEMWQPELPQRLRKIFHPTITWERALIRSGFKFQNQNNNSKFTFENESESNRKYLNIILQKLKLENCWSDNSFSPPQQEINEEFWLNAIEQCHSGAEGGQPDDLSIMDTYVAGVICWLNEIGIKTTISCDGHSRRPHSIGLSNPRQSYLLSSCLSLISAGRWKFENGKITQHAGAVPQVRRRDSIESRWLLDVAEKIYKNKKELSEVIQLAENIK